MTSLAILFRAGSGLVALPVEHVVETMRPLPYQVIADTPPFVLGAAVVRGQAVPVVDVGALLGARERLPSRRWISVRAGARVVVLAVAEVVGVKRLPRSVVESAPAPLLRAALDDAASAISVLDGELLLVLEASTLIPAEVWPAVDLAEPPLARGGP